MPLVDWGTQGGVKAAPDTTGQNPGKLTTVVNLTQSGLRLSQYVIYHMVLENLTIGAEAKETLNASTWGYFGPATGTGREWFGALYMKSGDELRFYWSLSSSASAPILTPYIVYDPDLPGNAP